MSPLRRIHLIRHGETPSNAARVFQVPETPLSERGRAQAEAVARRLAGHTIGMVVASDYERAAHTGRLIAAAAGVALELEPLLRERNFGALRGRAYADIEGDPFRPGYAPPEGESWDSFHERSDRAWSAVVERAAECEGDLAVVTHGLVCRRFADRWLDAREILRSAPAGGLAFANTSVTVIDAAPPHAIERLACTAHLDAPELLATRDGGRA